MVTANKPTIESYLYGAVADKAIRDEQPELAGHIMKQRYFTDRSNPVLALSYVHFYDALKRGDNPFNNPVGERIQIERTKYGEIMEGMTLKDITNSCLGTGLEKSLGKELIKKDGEVKFGKAMERILDYQQDAKGKEDRFKRKKEETEKDYERAMLGAYTEDERREVSDKFSDKLRKLQKSIRDDLKKLEDKYKIKDSQRAVTSVRAMEDAKFSAIRRDAVINDAYFPVKLEDLRRISQN